MTKTAALRLIERLKRSELAKSECGKRIIHVIRVQYVDGKS